MPDYDSRWEEGRESTYEQAIEIAWRALNAADAESREATERDPLTVTDCWRRHIGPLRHALRGLLAIEPHNDQPDRLIGWVSERIEIYAQHAGWRAMSEMQRRFGYRSIAETELDTGVEHGPAGLDIRWGCIPIPRHEV